VETAPEVKAVAAQSANVTGVSEAKTGVYCVSPAASIEVAKEAPVVSPEISYSTGNAPGLIAVNVQHPNCAGNAFEVDTFAPATSAPTGGYAFTIVVP
jgi:hypothetical protein